MKKLFSILSLITVALFSFTSCDEENDSIYNYVVNEGNWYEAPSVAPDFYVLNCGNWDGNDASVQYCNFNAGMVTSPLYDKGIFAQQNANAILGDLAQDMLWVKDKLFVTISGSQKIEILNENGKRLRAPIKFEAEGAWPRMLATDGENVYVTNYDGNVYVYNAETAEFVKTISVGTRPEGICYCDGYLVVNNSGDLYAYNGTVSVIKLETGESRSINLTNPYTASVVCNGAVYIIDSGNYYDILSNIYRISLEDATAQPLNICASAIATYENTLYYVNNSWSNEAGAFVASPLYALDVVTNSTQEVLAEYEMGNVNSLSVNPENGDIFVGYNATENGVLGTMHIYNMGGKLKSVFDVGYYTCGARFENR